MKHSVSRETSTTKEMMYKFYETFSTEGYECAALSSFSEDIVYENPAGFEISGRDNVIAYMKSVHRGDAIKETIRPIIVLVDGEDVSAQLVIQLFSTIDVPDHNIIPLKKGDKVAHRVSAWYKIRNNRISHLKVYPPAELTPKQL